MQEHYRIAIANGTQDFTSGDGLLLDAALEQGISLPFSCRRGECGCCRVRVLEGRHRRAPYQALGTPYPLGEDEMLLCQSHACSDMRIEVPGWPLPAQTAEPPEVMSRILAWENAHLFAGPPVRKSSPNN